MKALPRNLIPFVCGSFMCAGLVLNVAASDAIISEFMAENSSGLRDEDGDRPDWIEIFNPGPGAVDLGGWFLTDSATDLTKWRFPAVTLPPNEFLVVWASGKDRTNSPARLHTNFRLDKTGEYLALVDSGSNIVSEFSPGFPLQQKDVSYGRHPLDPMLTGFFQTPTPGAPNSTIGPGFASEPVFSLASGVYTNDSLTLTISAAPTAAIYYTLDGSAPTPASRLYTGPIVFGTNLTIKAIVMQPGVLPSTIAARTYVLLDSSLRNFDSNLPLLILNAGGGIPEDVPPGSPRRRGGLVAIDNQMGRASLRGTPQFVGTAEFEIFGQTSVGFEKQPYRIEVQDAAGRDVNVPLLGLPADADWQLQNPYNDKSFLNDFLGFELFEKMGRYAPRRRFVEVFVDKGTGKLSYPQDYYGIMVLFEKIEVSRHRVDIAELTPAATSEPEITGGYIFKRDKVSVGDLDFTTQGGGGFLGIPLKLHEPKPNDLKTAAFQGVTTIFPGNGYTPAGSNQMAYLRNFLGTMERALYTNTWLTQTGTNHYSHYLDADSFVDQHWIVEFTKQIDGIRLSSFFTKDRGGKVKMEPIWGWKLSFGNANFAQGGLTNGWYYELMGEQDHPWLRRLISGTTGAQGALGDPDFTQKIVDRWGVLRTNIFNATNVNDRIRELAGFLGEAAARDFARYPRLGVYFWPNPDGTVEGRDVDYVHPTNYFGRTTNSIIGQMTRFVRGRYLWIDGQFTRVPTFSGSSGMVTNGSVLTLSAEPGATIYFTLDGTDPREPGGDFAWNAVSYSGPLTITSNVHVVARARKSGSWKGTWSSPAALSLYTVLPPLRITEVMYHPAAPPPGLATDADNFEFVEVKNISGGPLNVNGFTLSGGVQFTFPNVELAAGQSAVVVNDVAAFQSRYGNSILVLGEFTGQLDNSSARLVLSGNLGEPIHDFTYSDDWYPATDGFGFSLVTVDETAPLGNWRTAAGWRPSSMAGGSPGAMDGTPVGRPTVLVNEVLSHGEPPLMDYIELYNPNAEPVNISGWFVTDEFQTPKKYRLPDPMVIAPYDFAVLVESNFNAAPGTSSSFTLNRNGDAVFLFSGDGTNLTGHAHGFEFGAAPVGVSFGRYVSSIGQEQFVAQQERTRGASNSSPQVGPVVISEIMFHPPEVNFTGDNTGDEFIELRNLATNAVALFDPSHPTNTWQITGAITYGFPNNVSIASGERILVVGFDPVAQPQSAAAFRARNGVPNSVPLYGPWTGHLPNDGGNIELRFPDTPRPSDEDDVGSPIVVPYVLAERVSYSSAAPWPAGTDLGVSLQRIVPGGYGNDPANWAAAAPTPGSDYAPGTVPAIISQPANQNAIFGTNLVLAVQADGTPPLRYQWRFEGDDISGATNASLLLGNFGAENAGLYNVRVFNSGGVAVSSNFVVAGRFGLQIVQQPVSRIVSLGGMTNFNVVATAGQPIQYQWRLNGTPVSNGSIATLVLTNVQPTNEGIYTCVVSDGYDTFVTQPATLTIVFKPVWTLQPISQTAAEGGSVTFTVAASGTTPIHFRWRTNGFTFTNAVIIATPSNSSLTIHNLTTNFDGMRFNVAPTNIAGQGVLSTNAFLAVLRDSDGDGLPDTWEQGREGFSPNDPSDALRDDDHDGMNNRDEYIAGTDYLDAFSYLKVQLSMVQGATIRFMAISNRTYSVQYSDVLGPAQWNKLADILARPLNREEAVPDPMAVPKRYYRLVTPVQP
jgi:hypothetical protein